MCQKEVRAPGLRGLAGPEPKHVDKAEPGFQELLQAVGALCYGKPNSLTA